MRRRLRAFAVLHPAPSVLNAVLVAALALVAGAAPSVASLMGLGMLGFQFSIGALNDLVDADGDRRAGRSKPIPLGLVSVHVASAIVVGGAIVGLAVSASFGLAVLVLGVLGYGAGVAYDVSLRQRGLGWLCFALAFPTLLAWTWMAAAGSLPPAWPLLLALAAAAGPAIHLANSLVDEGTDDQVGVTTLATRLGPTRARWALTGLSVVIYVLGWIALSSYPGTGPSAIVAATCATVVAVSGVWLSWQRSRRALEVGWIMQAVSIGVFGIALVASVD